MPIGTVKFFDNAKGYGFIQPEGSGNDAFVHVSAVERLCLYYVETRETFHKTTGNI